MKNIIDMFEDEIEPFLRNICVNENQLNAYVGCLGDVALKYFIKIIGNEEIKYTLYDLKNIEKERS